MDKTIAVRVADDQYERLHRLSRVARRNKSDLVRRCIEDRLPFLEIFFKKVSRLERKARP